MKNHFPLLLLAFFALSACQDNQQIVSTLIHNNDIIHKNNSFILDELSRIADIKQQFVPLYDAAKDIYEEANKLNSEFKTVLSAKNSANIDHSVFLEKCTKFCQYSKRKLLEIYERSQKRELIAVFIRREQIDKLRDYESDIVALKEKNSELYLLMLQINILSATNDAIYFLRDNASSLDLGKSYSEMIIASTPKPSVVVGEEYKAEISLIAYRNINNNFKLNIDGAAIPLIDGKGIYRARPKKSGRQTYTANVQLSNPFTGEVIKFNQKFQYEVLPAKKF
jgi:hypothetical protein